MRRAIALGAALALLALAAPAWAHTDYERHVHAAGEAGPSIPLAVLGAGAVLLVAIAVVAAFAVRARHAPAASGR